MTDVHPVTLGDLRVLASPPPNPYRKATVADLVSALRAEGALVVEKVEGEWPEIVRATILDHLVLWTSGDKWQDYVAAELLDALAEAQPFPPAGGVS